MTKQNVACNQMQLCNADSCEHMDSHELNDDCVEYECDSFNNTMAKCIPVDEIPEPTQKQRIEQILERVEEGTTTQGDADVLREAINWKEINTVKVEQNIDVVTGNLTGAKISFI